MMPCQPIRSLSFPKPARVRVLSALNQLVATNFFNVRMPGSLPSIAAVEPPANSVASVMLAESGPCKSALANALSSPLSEFCTAYCVTCSASNHGLRAAIATPPTARPPAAPTPLVAICAPLATALPAAAVPTVFSTPRLTIFSATSVPTLRTSCRPAVIALPVSAISAP